MPLTLDTTTLQMALIGYEAERQKIVAKILELGLQLKGRNHDAATPVVATLLRHVRRRMSAAARKRIADAQRKRWAEYHKRKKS